MPLTAIETALFSHGGTHAITACAIGPTTIKLSVAPWADTTAQARDQLTDQAAQVHASFQDVRALAQAKLADASENQKPPLPWDIIGFDSYVLDHNRWRFVLQCSEIGYMWESAWPQREPSNSILNTSADDEAQPSLR